jgi:ATP-binding cassette, subfamily F, member 3
VSQIANKIWYIEDKQIKEYPGTYNEYEYWRKKTEASELAKPEPPKPKPEKKQEAAPKSPSQEIQLKGLEKELKKIEEQITKLQAKKQSLEGDMALPDVYSNFEKLRKVQEELANVNKELTSANSKWEELAIAIDDLGSKGK